MTILVMADFIRPLPIECLGCTGSTLRSSKEILFFTKDVTENVFWKYFFPFMLYQSTPGLIDKLI